MQKTGKRNKGQEPKKKLKTQHSYSGSLFRWSFSSCEWEHRNWQGMTAQRLATAIIGKLQDYETQTWQEVLAASGGKAEGNGNNNHYIAPEMLKPHPEEYKRFIQKYARDFEKVFSLRLTGKHRLVGVVDRAIFRILWNDEAHEFF